MDTITTSATPRWIELKRDGKTAWLDMVDDKFAFGGDLEPSDAARVFFEELGQLLDDRVQEAARKIVKDRDR